ncbi:ethanolamine ammonia-lyase subunit EutC [Rhodococcoides kyotonense]|uniref:Ethanolamine ammonia-lyase small subunit n=1 Tax=Rhodococcoides kyotonense TaxID=398843 RepID=A0A239FHV0_9NOCA|nr:ethanolamine ammonia-lyase subunit EutC [Rhodococcus kyotonensis]SNS56335.1 ethanolamine ammonia-lyase small subunit [Rhodococcus kyotonensis]
MKPTPALADLTPARIRVGRAGTAYPTSLLLQLRADHATARDAVHTEVDFTSGSLAEDAVHLRTAAADRDQYLVRPDLGRVLDTESRAELARIGTRDADLQIVLGDGLSGTAVARQVPLLLPGLMAGARSLGWTCGRIVTVRNCRVGVMNDVGRILGSGVVVLLIGERPGLRAADSLSAYMGWRPGPGNNDADRNLVANIHARGVRPDDAADRILDLAAQMQARRYSGVAIKENLALPAVRAEIERI